MLLLNTNSKYPYY